jgi:hypothetical protein
MDLSLIDSRDENACYAKLVAPLHPDGLVCPQGGARQGRGIPRRHRAPVLDDQGGTCDRVFNPGPGPSGKEHSAGPRRS